MFQIRFLPGDPRAGSIAQMDSLRGQELINTGAAERYYPDREVPQSAAASAAPAAAATAIAPVIASTPAAPEHAAEADAPRRKAKDRGTDGAGQ